MTIRTVSAQWNGTLKEGTGVMRLPGANFEGPYTFASRFEEGEGTNPEELVGAAIAGCFSMFLSALISKTGITPSEINTQAAVDLGKDDKGPKITSIQLTTDAKVPSISETDFQALVQEAKENCPIAKLYTGTVIEVAATLQPETVISE